MVPTASDLLADQIAAARIVVQSAPGAGPAHSAVASTAVPSQPSSPVPAPGGWMVAKGAGSGDIDLDSPPSALRSVSAHAAEQAAHAAQRVAQAEREAAHAAAEEAAHTALSAEHAAKDDNHDLSPTAAKPAATVAPVVPQPAGPARTGHGDGKHAVEGDGLSGPSAHH